LREHYRLSEINTNAEGLSTPARVLRNLWCMARVLAARCRGGMLYLTPHRSLLGCAKDLLAIALWQLPVGTRGVVCHLHGADFRAFLAGLPAPLAAIARSLYRRVDLWILLSERMKDQIELLSPHQTCVLENCVTSDGAVSNPPAPRAGALRLLFLSNLFRSKGVLELCEAVSLASASAGGPPLELKVAGAPMESGVETAVRAAAAAHSNISYVGPVYGAAKRNLLEWADIVALPSSFRSEAQPLCLLEGALAGCYLIASRAGYITDLATNLRIQLLDDTSAATIARALLGLHEDEVRIQGAANREAALLHYSVDAFTSKFGTYIAAFLGQRG